jgi:hypothetical protein
MLGDHILDVEAIAERTKAVIVSNAEIAVIMRPKGFRPILGITVEGEKVHFLAALLTEEIQAVLLSRENTKTSTSREIRPLLWT